MQVVQQALPTGVDGTKIAEWQMRDGTNFGQFIALVGTAIGDFNQEMMRRWGGVLSITEMDHFEYPDGGSVTEMPPITDIDRPDIVHGQTIGHMIELNAYGRALGGSWRFFRDARAPQLRSTIQTFTRQAEWRFEKGLLTRALTNTEFAIGSGGYNVPFVRGTGGNVDFTPPAFGGEAFASSHDHFIFNNTGYAELLNAMAETLQEHGHTAPFDCTVSRADVASYAAEDDFIKMVAPTVQIIDRGSETTGPRFFNTGTPMVAMGELFGGFQSDYGLINLYSSARIPTDYAWMYKSYGNNDPRNSLAVRVHPDQGFGLFIVVSASDETRYPINRLNVEFEFGVGVGEDRTNGVAGKQNSSWTNPTIS
jgi:hypothetical protein